MCAPKKRPRTVVDLALAFGLPLIDWRFSIIAPQELFPHVHFAMTTSTRIPPILQPYIQLPHDESLLLLTSTLGASANWLLVRFICDALKQQSSATDDGGEGHNVVLVSWMREYEFWKQEARKGAGLDLDRLRGARRFAFVDGLSGLCLDASSIGSSAAQVAGNGPTPGAARPAQVLPTRGPPGRVINARGPAISSPATGVIAATEPANPANAAASAGHFTFSTLDVAHLKTTVSNAVAQLASESQRKTFIILDNPDLLLALNPACSPSAFTSTLLTLHTLPTVSHILTHIQADDPLLSLSTPPQPLELSHHNLLVKCAHMSRRILGVRVLDTGVARDVSGVVRVTEQKTGWTDLGFRDRENGGDGESGRGKEFLYQVKGDGSVKVFDRGAGGEN